MKFDNQLRYASTIIVSYKGEIPLHAWLKDFFRGNPQMGSRDRKQLSNMVYGFYRLGHALKDIPVEERILIGLFLCNDSSQELLSYFRPEWNAVITRSLAEKIALCRQSGFAFEPTDIFPWKDELSEGIDHAAYCLSFLRQPDLFLRIRPGHEKAVLDKLARHQPLRSTQEKDLFQPVSYEFIPPFTIRLPNGFKVEEWFTPDKEVVIQDYSSQKIAAYLHITPAPSTQSDQAPLVLPSSGAADGPQLPPPGTPPSFWDACAASGGKSILAFDLNPFIDITVSDIRESILRNLRERFRQAGLKNYHSFVANLAVPAPAMSRRPKGHQGLTKGTEGSANAKPGGYDLILADVPCSGSGTWSRTPEELYFFDPDKILHYHSMQKKIVANILPRLSGGGHFVYSTCSVFRKENEEIAALIHDSFGLQLDHLENIKGYDQRADSMFAARFIG